MKIYSVPITKAQLDKIPELERAFYIHLGHLRNELMVLLKFLTWSVHTTSDNPVLVDVNVCKSFIISRLLAGKLWEGWELMRKAYFATKVSMSIESNLPDDTKIVLAGLKKYFGKKNVIDGVRNQFAFHYDPQRIRTQLASVDESDSLKIYVAETADNNFFQVSDIIAGSAMLETVEPGDYVAATTKFITDMIDVCVQFVKFCDGCLDYMMQNYMTGNAEGIDAEEVEIPDPPDDIQLPYFEKH
jgi:hypothetical protein